MTNGQCLAEVNTPQATVNKNMRYRSTPDDVFRCNQRILERACDQKTDSLANQIRGLLSEYGIVVPKGIVLNPNKFFMKYLNKNTWRFIFAFISIRHYPDTWRLT